MKHYSASDYPKTVTQILGEQNPALGYSVGRVGENRGLVEGPFHENSSAHIMRFDGIQTK